MSDSDVDAVTFELSWYSTHICLTVVIWEQHLGLDGSRSLNQLFWCHRVGLVAGKECDVDIFDILHLRNVLRITGDIDSQPVNGQYVAIVATFRMELCSTLRGVIGRYCFNLDDTQCSLLIIQQPQLLSPPMHPWEASSQQQQNERDKAPQRTPHTPHSCRQSRSYQP